MTLNNDELEHDITTLRGEMELEDYMIRWDNWLVNKCYDCAVEINNNIKIKYGNPDGSDPFNVEELAKVIKESLCYVPKHWVDNYTNEEICRLLEEREEICETCSYYYHDGFCTYHLSYWSPDHTCPKWTDEELELDYDFLYRRCQDYIRICEMYNHYEKLKKENPDAIIVKAGTSNEDFFLQCCLNDLKRELSLWTLKK